MTVGINASTTGFRYGYTGREQDSETGLDYYRARYYDSANGRFISEDPIRFAAGDTNIYRYVGNSPTNGTDPFGLFDWGEFREKLNSVGGNLVIKHLMNTFTKKNYYHSDFPPGMIGWKFWLQQLLPGSTEHATDFMEYYFHDVEGENSAYADPTTKPPFDLGQRGILESIKSIPKMKKATENFESLMKNKIAQQISNFKEKSKCTPCTPEYITVSMNADLHGNNLNLTSDGNFTLGRTKLKSFGSATVVKECNGNVRVFATQLHYEIEDDFEDAADIKTLSKDVMQELPGGVGYKITGKWSKKIDGYE
jgi:RHS repeat-associated protein